MSPLANRAISAASAKAVLTSRPQLRGDAVLGAVQRRGPSTSHQVRVLGTGTSVEIGPREYFVLSRLDGRRSLGEIGAVYEREFGKVLGPAQWGQLLGLLHRHGLLAAEEAAREEGSRTGAGAAAGTGSEAGTGPGVAADRRRGGFSQDAPWTRVGLAHDIRLVQAPNALLEGLLRSLRPVFWRVVAWPLLAAMVSMLALLGTRLNQLWTQTTDAFQHPGALLAVAAGFWVIAALHELAHGVAARRYAVPVREIGVRWLPPLAMPYCRTDSYLFLPGRLAQVVIAGAGVFAELLVLIPAFATWWWWPPGGEVEQALAALLLLVSAHALLNLVPAPPLDGYRMLSHALGLRDYAQHSGIFVALLLRRDPLIRRYPTKARAAYAGYAALSLLTLVALVGGLAIAAHTWFGGWRGVATTAVLALAAVALIALTLAVRVRRRRTADAAHRQVHDVDPTAVGGAPVSSQSPRAPKPPEPHPVESAPVRGRAIELVGVVKKYGELKAVDDVTLSVLTGEFLGLLGPNGAGKSTLVEVAVGLRQADAGAVSVLGESPWPRRPSLLPRIGVQTQSAAFFVRLTASEHLRTVAALYGLGSDAAEQALRLVGLEASADIRAEALSGGQRQRLAIATALVHDPELIFLDEPTASLDPQARRELWSVLRDLNSAGRTVVYTTHHLDEAEALCTRVAIMAHGRVVAEGAPYELIEHAVLPTRLVVPRGTLPIELARRLPRVSSAIYEGATTVIETHDSAAVLAELETMGIGRGVQTRPPTLEDVYLARIGMPKLDSHELDSSGHDSRHHGSERSS
jgi:ABC-type multidrug transport system ATPase subunit